MSDPSVILTLPVADIRVDRPRVGVFNAATAAELGAGMLAIGQHTAILVQQVGDDTAPSWSLIAGYHRLEGARIAGLVSVHAIVAAGPEADEATLLRLEVSENLDRRDLLPLERSKFLHARARLAQLAQHGEHADEPSYARAVRMRTEEKGAVSFSHNKYIEPSNLTTAALQCRRLSLDDDNWDELVASEAGLKPRQSRKYRAIYRDIVEPFPEHVPALNAHRLGASLSAMERLTQLRVEERLPVIEAILADPDLATIDAAITAAGLKKSRGNRGTDKILSIFTGLKKAERLYYGKALIKLSPPGVRRDLGIAAIAQCPERRADFVAAAMAGLTAPEIQPPAGCAFAPAGLALYQRVRALMADNPSLSISDAARIAEDRA